MTSRSEINPLKKVIIHSPGIEHHFTLPENTFEWTENKNGKMIHNPDYLLFDDLISPSQMKDEHSQLVDILNTFTGYNNTIQCRDLLTDVLETDNNKAKILEECIKLDLDLYGHRYSLDKRKLLNLNSNQFLNIILSGRWENSQIDSVLKWPLPNLIFFIEI